MPNAAADTITTEAFTNLLTQAVGLFRHAFGPDGVRTTDAADYDYANAKRHGIELALATIAGVKVYDLDVPSIANETNEETRDRMIADTVARLLA